MLTVVIALAGVAGFAVGAELDVTSSLDIGEPLVLDTSSCSDLQTTMDQLAATGGGSVVLASARDITCTSFERNFCCPPYQREFTPLLIPERVSLDLNGSRLLLRHTEANSYGIRISRHSALRNGRVSVESIGPGSSQAIFHSAIAIGAALDHGGTVAQPSYYAEVYDWTIEDLTLIYGPNARDGSSVIGIMSAAHHGVIRDVVIPDSDRAGIGIAMDWGRVGVILSEAQEQCANRIRYLAGEAYTTHPHDILVQNVSIGRLTRPLFEDSALSTGLRTSACYNITVNGLTIQKTTYAAVAVDAGDMGFEFAVGPQSHAGLEFHNITQWESGKYGVYVNGLADNIYRAN